MRTYEFDVMGPLERTRISTSASGVYTTVLLLADASMMWQLMTLVRVDFA